MAQVRVFFNSDVPRWQRTTLVECQRLVDAAKSKFEHWDARSRKLVRVSARSAAVAVAAVLRAIVAETEALKVLASGRTGTFVDAGAKWSRWKACFQTPRDALQWAKMQRVAMNEVRLTPQRARSSRRAVGAAVPLLPVSHVRLQ